MPYLNERREAANGDPPPPDSLRVWVCPSCGTTLTELGAGRHECPACEAAVLNRPVEYLPATDLERLRETLKKLVETEDAAPINCGCQGCADKVAALSHARDLLDGKA